ncbi:MAG TPA: hypothetical protein VGB19_16210 [Actinomycetota bacterium]
MAKRSSIPALLLVLAASIASTASARGAHAAGADDTPTARFTYRAVDRYADRNGDGYFDPATTSAQIAEPFHLELDGCESDGGGAPIRAFAWEVNGRTLDDARCNVQALFSREGTFQVTLTVSSRNGTDSLTKGVVVRDLLIVSIGDSLASGEGNPYRTVYRVDSDVHGNRVRIPIGGVWQDRRCHRSEVAGPAQAARYLELADTHSTVTFVHLACSGASIVDSDPNDNLPEGGLLDPYRGIEPPEGAGAIPPQVDQVAALVGSQHIDALLLSIGANDVGFSDIVLNCLVNIFGCDQHHAAIPDAVDIWDERSPLLPGRYDQLDAALRSKLGAVLDPGDVYVPQYFDPTFDEKGKSCDPLIPGMVDGAEGSWASTTVVGGLNSMIAQKAAQFGWHDVAGIVADFRGPPGHGYCAEPHWILRLEESLQKQGNQYGAFHPCAPGHGSYRDHLAAAVIAGLGLHVPAPTPGKDVVAGVRCTSPPESFLSNRDGDASLVFGVPAPIPDVLDNCPNVFNPDQADFGNGKQSYTMGDGVGDACAGYTVNTAVDFDDGNTNDGYCDAVDVEKQDPSNMCSLRAAIQQASSQTAGTEDRITFSIATALGPIVLGGTQTLRPGTRLPPITRPVFVDGTTQPLIGLAFPDLGFGLHLRCWKFTGHPCIELDGETVGGCSACPGLETEGAIGAVIDALAVNRFSGQGIILGGFGGCGTRGSGNRVEESFIGTDVFGELDLGNGREGIAVDGVHNVVGGTLPWQRNVISGNDGHGIFIGNSCATDNLVLNNFIGTDVSGSQALGNGMSGVDVNGPHNLIGGLGPEVRNVISSNGGDGISFFNAGSNTVAGNYIGTAVDGVTALANHGNGVAVSDGNDNETVGGMEAGAGNIIAFNDRNGVFLYEGTGHRVLGNSIHDNGKAKGLAIDIGNCSVCVGDVSLNDPGDADVGFANETQNFPVLNSVTDSGANTSVLGRLDSNPDEDFTLQFFLTGPCDPSHHGEADRLLGTRTVHTDGSGEAQIAVTLPGTVADGKLVSATATDEQGNTSELSRAVGADGPCISTFTVNATGDQPDGDLGDDRCDTGSVATVYSDRCTLRAAIEEANDAEGRDIIRFAIGTGPHTISLRTALPLLTEAVVIDATTQPGWTGAPIVELDGHDLSSNVVDGLVVLGGDSVVKGLVVDQMPDDAILITEGGSNRIEGNVIGLRPDGRTAGPNGGIGIHIVASSKNQIGGTTPASRNVISGNDVGIWIDGPSSTDNVVQGNRIGTAALGTSVRGNEAFGIRVNGGTGTVIGGFTPGSGNLVSGNHEQGVIIDAPETRVWGNRIGTDVTGTKAMGNGRQGIVVHSADNTIGGSGISANVVSANGWAGVEVNGSGATGNLIVGNLIGTDPTGRRNLGNHQDGIYVQASDTRIGGLQAGQGNTVGFNGQAGILIGSGTGNAVRSNEVFSNATLGIDLLGSFGVTPNDATDADTGTNGLQNFPVLTSAATHDGSTVVKGFLSSTKATAFTIQLFASLACDGSGNGEGQRYLGSVQVTTDGTGRAAFSRQMSAAVAVGQAVTATATDPAGNTSEFSACRRVL